MLKTTRFLLSTALANQKESRRFSAFMIILSLVATLYLILSLGINVQRRTKVL